MTLATAGMNEKPYGIKETLGWTPLVAIVLSVNESAGIPFTRMPTSHADETMMKSETPCICFFLMQRLELKVETWLAGWN